MIEYLSASSTKLITLNEILREGPYFALGQRLHQAWRLYPDVLSAFATAVIPNDEEVSSSIVGSVQKYETRVMGR